MSYSHIKSRPLNDEEKKRLRISIGTELRLKGIIRRPSTSQIASQLTDYLESPRDDVRPELLNWLFSYGTPGLLAHLIDSVARLHLKRPSLQAMLRAGKERILPREHITPEIQKIQTKPHPKSALVCFTGHAQRLNLPVQLVHFLAADQFDLIFYLRDPDKKFFAQGISGLSKSLDQLIADLRQQIPVDCHVAVLSTSGGGYAAARFAEEAGASRLAMFSPLLKIKNVAAISTPARMMPENVRIFFARGNPNDVLFASEWGITDYALGIRWFNTNTHGTLRYLFSSGHLKELFDWLLGGPDLIPYTRLSDKMSPGKPAILNYV